MTVRTRFAPSPTGYLHIGGARTALFSWLFARRFGGEFILRIEDTDQKRTIEGAADALMDAMQWLGITWDEGPDIGGPHGPYVQSERKELYHKWAHWLVDNGHAYKCFATAEELEEMRQTQIAAGVHPHYDRRSRNLSADQIATFEADGRPYVIRHKMPLDGQTVVPDLIRGDITFENSQITDYVLFKSTGLPTYHLANVVDDHFMGITHVTRGDEWVNTAPVHIQLWKAFGWDMPVYAHMPVILNPSGGGKLSKRTQSFQDQNLLVLVRVNEFQENGYLPDAVVNFLTNVGWAFGDDREIFTVAETLERFALEDVNAAPTKLPYSKLDWINGQYIQNLPPEELAQLLMPFLHSRDIEISGEMVLALAPVINMRLKRLTDVFDQILFLDDEKMMDAAVNNLTHKKMGQAQAISAFTAARDLIAGLSPADFNTENLGNQLRAIGETHTDNNKAGPFLGTMPFAVTRQKVSPPLFESVLALGQDRAVSRINLALNILNG